MDIPIVTTPAITLQGLSVRTKPSSAGEDIMEAVSKFKGLLTKDMPARDTYCVYTDYESNYKGAYTFFVGTIYQEKDILPDHFKVFTLPQQDCLKFITDRGPMPTIIIDEWQKIWKLEDTNSLGGKRLYKADYEIYRQTEVDPLHMQVEVFLGIKPHNPIL